MRPLGKATIYIYRPDITVESDGSQWPAMALDEANATLMSTVKKCSVQPFRMAEKLQNELNLDRQFASTTKRVFAPPGTVVAYNWWVKYNDVMYEAFGFPGDWSDQNETPHHVEFLILRREG